MLDFIGILISVLMLLWLVTGIAFIIYYQIKGYIIKRYILTIDDVLAFLTWPMIFIDDESAERIERIIENINKK